MSEEAQIELSAIEALQIVTAAAAFAPLPRVAGPGQLSHNLVEVALMRLHEALSSSGDDRT